MIKEKRVYEVKCASYLSYSVLSNSYSEKIIFTYMQGTFKCILFKQGSYSNENLYQVFRRKNKN